ncbi:MAG: hypothetical protein ACO331_10935 [Prochlorothrix sp.]
MIEDFSHQDSIGLADGLTYDQLIITQVGDDVLISHGDNPLVTVLNTTTAQLGSNVFEVV